jgi:hypothetical protein
MGREWPSRPPEKHGRHGADKDIAYPTRSPNPVCPVGVWPHEFTGKRTIDQTSYGAEQRHHSKEPPNVHIE